MPQLALPLEESRDGKYIQSSFHHAVAFFVFLPWALVSESNLVDFSSITPDFSILERRKTFEGMSPSIIMRRKYYSSPFPMFLYLSVPPL